MKIKKTSYPVIVFLLITILFFYKTFIHGYIPFPGDLLTAEYNPWKYFSFLGYSPGSYPNKGQYFDVIRQIYPWKTFTIASFQKGQIPFWNPYNFSGTPLLANFQSAVFYPLNVFYFLMPQVLAWSLLIFLQPFLSGIFTYFFAREKRITRIGSYLSGVSFAFCSFMTVWLQYNTIDQVILWLPLQLLSIEKLLIKRSIPWMILFIFSLVAEQFGGHPQIFIYSFIFSIFYMFHRIIATKKNLKKQKIVIFFILLSVVGLGIGSIQNLPGLALMQLSARSAHTYADIMSKILIQPWQLLMLVVPDIFGNPATRNYWLSDTYIGKVTSVGLIPFIFSLVSITQMRKSIIRFFWGALFITLLLATNNPLTEFLYSFQIPFLSSSAPTLAIFIFCFCLSILAGYGVDVFRSKRFTTFQIILWLSPILIIFLVIFISIALESRLGFYAGSDHARIAMHNTVYVFFVYIISIILLIFGMKKKKILVPILILLIVIHLGDAFKSFEKFNPFVPQQLVFPQNDLFTYLQQHAGINRIWSFGSAQIEANVQTHYQIFSPEGYDPLYPKYYGSFIQSSQNGQIITHFTDRTRSDANIAPAQSENFMRNTARLKVLNLLGVKYFADTIANGSTQNTFPPSEFKNIYHINQWNVYQNVQAVPRTFLATDYVTYASANDFSKKFFASTFHPQNTILLEKKLSTKLNASKKELFIIDYSANKVRLMSKTNGSALLFLSDTYYPDWQATIDGKPVQILRADYAFRAILVPKGNHQVSFTFSSSSFKIGSIISFMSMLTLIAWLFSLYIGNLGKAYAKK